MIIDKIKIFIKSLFIRHEVIDHPKQTFTENEKRLNKKYWYLYPHWRFVTDLFFDMKQYDSVDSKELHQAWKATGVNGKRQKVFIYNGFTWTRVAIKTYSRSRKSSAWEVYFECKETGEQIYQSMSPYMRY
tara:strand:- start:441 stop:833 length:393 start_codon:yes stop_codon:yes gene_type:complete